MRIVHVTDTFQPKLGYQDFFLAREQMKAGHDVTVVAADRYFRFPRYEETMAAILGPRVVGKGWSVEEGVAVVRLSTRLEVGRKMWLGGLTSTVQGLHPDIVHVHNIANFTATRLAYAKARIGGRMLFDDHMHLSILRKRRAVVRAGQWVQRQLFSRQIAAAGDAFVGISAETAQIMSDVYGIPAERIVVVPLGVDVELFRRDPDARREVRSRYRIADEEVVLAYTGKIIPDKGPDLLVEAAVRLRQEGLPIRVLLVGGVDRKYWQEIRALASRVDFEHLVVHHPAVPNADLYRLFSAADIGVWPREETMSMLEAAACELPIVVKQSASIEDRVSAGNGATYPEGDVAALADVLRMLLPQERRTAMGRRGRELVEARFSWETISNRFLELYESGTR